MRANNQNTLQNAFKDWKVLPGQGFQEQMWCLAQRRWPPPPGPTNNREMFQIQRVQQIIWNREYWMSRKVKLYLWKLILVSLWSHLKLMGECWNFFDDWKAENEPGQIGSYWCWWVVRILLTGRSLVSSQPLCRLRVQFLSCLTAHPTVHSILRDNWKTTKRWLCEPPPPCVSTAHWAAPTY